MSSTNLKIVLRIAMAVAACVVSAQSPGIHVSGTVLDPDGHPVPAASVKFASASDAQPTAVSGESYATSTTADGSFALDLPSLGAFNVHVEAAGFAPIARRLSLIQNTASLRLHMEKVSATTEEVLVTADVSRIEPRQP